MEVIVNRKERGKEQINENELVHQFAENLKWLRDVHSVTQSKIAKYLNIDRTSYCNYEIERTVPKIVTLKMIADFYNVTVDDLINVNLKK